LEDPAKTTFSEKMEALVFCCNITWHHNNPEDLDLKAYDDDDDDDDDDAILEPVI
jgi:hypothetical protein